jgi:hypothetical protein
MTAAIIIVIPLSHSINAMTAAMLQTSMLAYLCH